MQQIGAPHGGGVKSPSNTASQISDSTYVPAWKNRIRVLDVEQAVPSSLTDGLGSVRLSQTFDPFAGALSLPASLNSYTYVHGNPVRYTDPSGEFPLLALALVGLALGLVGGYGYEVYQNTQEGMGLGDALYYQNINWWVVGGAGVAAAVALPVIAYVGVQAYGYALAHPYIANLVGTTATCTVVGFVSDAPIPGCDLPFDDLGRVGSRLDDLANPGIVHAGDEAGEAARRTFDAMERLGRSGMADETIDEVAARVRLVKETRARAIALTTRGNPLFASNRQRKVLTGVTHPALNKVFFGLNHRTEPAELANVLKGRINYTRGYVETRGRYIFGAFERPGTHSEIYALNEAILARQAQLGRDVNARELPEFLLHNRWLFENTGANPHMILDIAPRCPHCHLLTSGVTMVGGY